MSNRGDQKIRACLVSTASPIHMVMSSLYTDFFDKNAIEYDLLYIDAYHEKIVTTAKKTYKIEFTRNNKFDVASAWFRFRKMVKRVFNTQKYDFVVVWNENTAALLFDILEKKYQGRYCVNVRDLFVGQKRILYPFLYRAIGSSSFTTVSSKKYLEDMPKNYNNYLVIHSLNIQTMEKTNEEIAKIGHIEGDKIRILYIGKIRFIKQLELFIQSIKNNNRFELVVAGQGSEQISEFLLTNKIENVKTIGRFPKEETAQILAKADVIYNLYGIEDINLRYALSNKLYYAIWLNIPILVYKDTYMFEESNRCGIGFAIDEPDNIPFAEKFEKWYEHLDMITIKQQCDNYIFEAIESQKKLHEEIKKYI